MRLVLLALIGLCTSSHSTSGKDDRPGLAPSYKPSEDSPSQAIVTFQKNIEESPKGSKTLLAPNGQKLKIDDATGTGGYVPKGVNDPPSPPNLKRKTRGINGGK